MARSNKKTEATTVETKVVTILKSTTAPKLNPHANGELEYDIALLDEKLAIRVSANLSGGFFSNEWILLDSIETCLAATEAAEVDFKSTMLKSVFTQGNSSNNAGFLCACLRAEGLLVASDKNIFFHLLVGDFDVWRKTLRKRKEVKPKGAKTTKEKK
jgi:hypothetical protein